MANWFQSLVGNFGFGGKRAAMVDPIVEDIDVRTLKAGLADGSIVLIDVREAHEWAAGHIRGALFNPLSHFDVAALPAASHQRIVLHCRSGKRSVTALGLAQEGGREDIKTHFSGGMLAWQAAGEPVMNLS